MHRTLRDRREKWKSNIDLETETPVEEELEPESSAKNSGVKTRQSKSKSPTDEAKPKNETGRRRGAKGRLMPNELAENEPGTRATYISTSLRAYFSSQSGYRFQYIRGSREIVYREGAPGIVKNVVFNENL